MIYTRYGIYYTPPEGDFAQVGADWLGWDLARRRETETADDALTLKPRKYGFHGTLKPPFFLAEGRSEADLKTALADLANRLAPVTLEGLRVTPLGAFLALMPEGDTAALRELAGSVVRDLDGFRAPPSTAELARRRAAGLSPVEEAHLLRWGYPYVMERFNFHMTLTGPLPKKQRAAVRSALDARFQSVIPKPFVVDGLTLVGEADSGLFHLVQRYNLGRCTQLSDTEI